MKLFLNITICTLLSWLIIHCISSNGLTTGTALVSLTTTIILQSIFYKKMIENLSVEIYYDIKNDFKYN